jgi:CRP/FNR family cyclic AMP-dependent transcriptional regulator
MALSIEVLRHSPLFASLSDHSLELIYRLAVPRHFQKGEIIFFEHDEAECVHLVVEGLVKIFCLADDGREKVLTFVKPGEIIGEMALFTGNVRSATGQAVEPTTTLVIYNNQFQRLLEEHGKIAVEIIKVLSQRLQNTNMQVMDAVFRDARSRLINTLALLGERFGTPEGGAIHITIRLTHQELASLVGTARETVSRILAELHSQGLLDVSDHRLVIVNMAELKSQLDII